MCGSEQPSPGLVKTQEERTKGVVLMLQGPQVQGTMCQEIRGTWIDQSDSMSVYSKILRKLGITSSTCFHT